MLKFLLIELETQPKFLKSEVSNVFNDISYIVEKKYVSSQYDDEISGAHETLSNMLSLVEGSSHATEILCDEDDVSLTSSSAEERLNVVVYSTKPTFAYAKDATGASYFIPLTSFNSKSPVLLRVGQKIKVWGYRDNEIRNNSRKANFAAL